MQPDAVRQQAPWQSTAAQWRALWPTCMYGHFLKSSALSSTFTSIAATAGSAANAELIAGKRCEDSKHGEPAIERRRNKQARVLTLCGGAATERGWALL